jgi:hypothetical protein
VGPASERDPVFPKEGEDLAVRKTVEYAGGKVDWPTPNGKKGERHMKVTTESGKEVELKEGEHFYIDDKGTAYFYTVFDLNSAQSF